MWGIPNSDLKESNVSLLLGENTDSLLPLVLFSKNIPPVKINLMFLKLFFRLEIHQKTLFKVVSQF